jgi:hypothetical protein
VSKVLREKNTFGEEKTLKTVKKRTSLLEFLSKKKMLTSNIFTFQYFFVKIFGSLVGFKVMFLGTSVE